ncbi:hypothetical protein [Acholeplasma hippikon]|uniref:Pesticidal crystal protein Cry22Aa Ig-like domain-containing protein n=1 Tax=Acholeplasma hippikon TaxID=264636 RepID=A0A449BIB8_9MOLU|nr:hypothetical protein [Acholeplasma hippikon]VEU82204.1 Uncharacterised protein [Acholeplasma hippikon]
MKKIYLILSICLLSLSLIGCNPKENIDPVVPPIDETDPDKELLEDKIAPILQFTQSTYRTARINQYTTDFNIFEGLQALDNLEGDISSRIEADLGDYDVTVPGEYEVFFFVQDLAGNVSNFVSKKITVVEYYFLVEKYPIFTGIIPNESAKPDKQKVFAGAYYHKVYSSKDYWLGIEAEFTLPMFDINRYNGQHDDRLPIDPSVKNLDNPSIYMGGHAWNESDVGLSLSLTVLKNGSTTIGSYAFRPFWRYITNRDYDIGGYDRANGRYYAVSNASGNNQTKNLFGNWDYLFTEYYYLPGDRLRMILYSPKPGYLQLQIQVIEKSTLPYSVQIREENGWKDPADFKSPAFSSPEHGSLTTKVEFKRVNAIDQSGNEGKPNIPTTSQVFDMVWHNTYLLRKIDGQMYRVVMNETRANFTNGPADSHFTTSGIDPVTGGETVRIHPNFN